MIDSPMIDSPRLVGLDHSTCSVHVYIAILGPV